MSLRKLVVIAAAACAVPAAAQESYVIDPTSSAARHRSEAHRHVLQRGSFGKLQGKVALDRAAKKGTVDLTIDANAIKPFDARLDPILRGPRFFNVEKLPTMEFKSDDVVFDGDRVDRMNGEFHDARRHQAVGRCFRSRTSSAASSV